MMKIRFILAFLISPAVPAVLLCIPGIIFGASISQIYKYFIIVCYVTYPHAFILGIPIVVILKIRKLMKLKHVIAAAFVIGALPITIFGIYQEITSIPGSGYVADGVEIRVNGLLTLAGWLRFIESVLLSGLLGALSGLAWWWIVGKSANNQLNQDAPKSGAPVS